jgi:hypothetical protein
MPCSSASIEILVEPDAVRCRCGARGVTGECLVKDEKDVRDERLEYVVSLLVYGLGDVLMVSRVEGPLRRLRDGVAGEEGAEGIVLKVEVGGRDKLNVATSFLGDATLAVDTSGLRQPCPRILCDRVQDPSEDTEYERTDVRMRNICRCSTIGVAGLALVGRALPQHMHDRFVFIFPHLAHSLLPQATHQMDL